MSWILDYHFNQKETIKGFQEELDWISQETELYKLKTFSLLTFYADLDISNFSSLEEIEKAYKIKEEKVKARIWELEKTKK